MVRDGLTGTKARGDSTMITKQQMSINKRNNKIDNLRFKITFSETNLRSIYHYEDEEEKKRLTNFHEEEIEKAKAEIAELESE
jgi:hypothetical protein